jgi:DNA-binding GntR family transcriptional regulator
MPKIQLESVTPEKGNGSEPRKKPASSSARPAVKPVTYAPLHEVVYREIRRALMQGRFEPGQRMTVRGLSDALGTSHMPVRAALSRLIAEKAFVQLSQRFIAVPLISGDKFRDLMETRMLLEGEAAARAAQTMPAAALDETRLVAGRLDLAIRKNNISAYLELNQELKFSIYAHCRSTTLLSLIELLWLQVGPILRYFARELKSLPKINFHGDAIEAIGRNDSAAARDWISRDIQEGMNFLLRSVDFPKDEDAKT